MTTSAFTFTNQWTFDHSQSTAGGSEIVAHDADGQRVFVVGPNGVDALSATTGELLFSIDTSAVGNANSVAVHDGVVAIAVAADDRTQPGKVCFYSTDGQLLREATVGANPDMVVFSADGATPLVANEGEPSDDYLTDPVGSVSIVDVATAAVQTAGFEAFNDRMAELQAEGVRIFGPNASVAQDLEPEYIAISPDGALAFVTLQENNAIAVVDIDDAAVLAIYPLGVKDHSHGQPVLETFDFDDRPLLGTTEEGEDIFLGGFSGLHFEGVNPDNGNLMFITVSDRGPNGDPFNADGDPQNERPFLLPEYQAQVTRFEVDEDTNEITITGPVLLTRQDGTTPITGLPNIPGFDEDPIDPSGDPAPYDELGGDLESIVVAADGTLIDRFVPEGTAALADPDQPAGTFGTETLPAEYSTRVANRGFEAVALDEDAGILYAFIQTPLANPDGPTSAASEVIRMLGIGVDTGLPVAEYVYLLEDPDRRAGGVVDKIGDATYAGDGTFVIVERDSGTVPTGKQLVFEFSLTGATNLLELPAGTIPQGTTLEQLSADELQDLGIEPVTKTKILNLPSVGYQPNDRTEGLTVMPDGRIAVLNDNDFGVAGINTVQLGLISFDDGNTLDASDRDDAVNLQNWPIHGMYMPDAIAAYDAGGQTYVVTANEGDARDYDGFAEETRVGDLNLDPDAFPNAAELQDDANLGRLTVSSVDGDIDGDGDVDQIFAYGGRSFSILDSFGNLVFDSGDMIERIVTEQFPELFDDTRSDNKGAEPEGLTIGEIGGRDYLFLGLERYNAVMIFDITSPTDPAFVDLIANEGDMAPEGFDFVSAEDGPTGVPLLIIGNEVSSTTTAVAIAPGNFTLQLLHASDLEGGVLATERAPNFAAIVDALEDDFANTIIVSSGDNYIPSPFFSASGDTSVQDELRSVCNQLFGLPADVTGDGTPDQLSDLRASIGRIDISIMNIIGFDAAALGNHEFDLGTAEIRSIVATDIRGTNPSQVRWLGTQFPYLSANLDFSGDPNLAPIFTPDILPSTDFQTDLTALSSAVVPPKIAPATIIDVNGERIGVVGATTPILENISSPGATQVKDPGAGTNDMTALASILQPTIDQLVAQGINKIIVASHLQQIAFEQQLLPLLHDVDIIIAGGSNTLLADSEDVARGLHPDQTPDASYPIVTTNADGDTAVIVNTDGEYSIVGRLVVEFDPEGKVIADSIDTNVSGAFATTDEQVEALWGNEDSFALGTKGNLAQTLADAAQAVIVAKDGNIFGSSEVFLDGRRGEVRIEETNFGNLGADANLALAKQVDPRVLVSIKNGGGIRDQIGTILTNPDGTTAEAPTAANPGAGKDTGDISQLDIENSLRFNNSLSLVTVTAQQLLQVIEHGVAAVAPGATPGQFPQVSGLSLSFDATRPANDRVLSLAVVDEDGTVLDFIARDGALVGDPGRAIRLVTLNFLAGTDVAQTVAGGDNYPFPSFIVADPDFADRVDLAGETADLNRNGTIDGAVSIDAGTATFAGPGTEQDAFVEFLADNFATTPFDIPDVGPEQDERIQNLAFRDDTVLATDPVAGSGTIAGTVLDDQIAGSNGADSLTGGEGNDVLGGFGGVDTIQGGVGNDSMFGGADNDRIEGSEGNDLLAGEAGNDTLTGGNGIDNLFGGGGADVFVVGGATRGPHDGLFDFSRGDGDKIQVQAIPGSPITSPAAAVAAQISDGHNTFLYLGALEGEDQWVIVAGTPSLIASDLVFA